MVRNFMRRLTLLTLALLVAIMPSHVLGLSEPHLYKPPYTGVPAFITVSQEGMVGIIFISRPVVGFFRETDRSYYEVQLTGVPSKLVLRSEKAYLIIPEPPQIIAVNILTGEVMSKELENRPGDLGILGERIIVTFPSARRLAFYDPASLSELDELRLSIADGLNVLTASGDYIWVLDESFTAVHVLTDNEVHTVDFGVIISALGSEANRLWIATADGKLITSTGWDRPGQSIDLPRGTVVDSPLLTAGGKVFYASPNRRTIGVVENGILTEKSMPTITPIHPSIGPGGKIWFIDGASSGIGWVADSKPPLITEVRAGRLPDGTIEISAKVEDTDGDMGPEGVMVQIIVYTGVYVSLNETLPMTLGTDGRYSATYSPPHGATRLMMDVVALDTVGNRAVSSIGEMDLTSTRTTAVTTTLLSTPTAEVSPTTVLSLVLELLLVIPLIVGLTYLALRGRGRRSKSRK
jgi:hypothetical protein